MISVIVTAPMPMYDKRETKEKIKVQLIEELKKFRDLAKTSQEMIFRLDDQGRFTYNNLAWERRLGTVLIKSPVDTLRISIDQRKPLAP